MQRILPLALLLCAFTAAPASADWYGDCWSVTAPAAPRDASTAGINLALGDCGAAGAQVAATNCASNSGVALPLVISAVPPPGVDRMVGFEARIEVVTSGSTLSPWWTLDGCRAGALRFSADFTALENLSCDDFWAGQATALGGVSPTHVAPNRFRIQLVAAAGHEAPIAPGVEHYLAKVNILRSKSTGAGSCAGCEEGACLLLSSVTLSQPAGVGDYVLVWTVHEQMVQYGAGTIVPARNRTWGQVKALYR